MYWSSECGAAALEESTSNMELLPLLQLGIARRRKYDGVTFTNMYTEVSQIPQILCRTTYSGILPKIRCMLCDTMFM